ncbi:alkaline phosphatase family protein [Arcanobacterium hippocoleae]|uniref:alkaline phosphatase family protein n=1 Tax=Arcanobacterium hippocoleae TaxID=149017 RepID=UPI003341DEA4
MQKDDHNLAAAIFPQAPNLSHLLWGAFGALEFDFAACDDFALNEHPAAIEAEAARALLGFPSVQRVCVVLVDGLGSLQLQARRGHVPNLRQLNLESKITTVVPSTTAAGISAFGTGMLPGQNAMAGYSLRSPRTGNTFSLIKWDGSGYNAPQWQSEPTLYERLSAAQRAQTAIIQPREYIGSGLSLAAFRGAPAIAAKTLEARLAAATAQFQKGCRMAYVYWGELDKVGHKYGWQSDQWIDELENLDREIGIFLRSLPPQTLVIFTADHGMVDATEKIDIAQETFLSKGVSQVAGEERAFQIYTDEPQELAQRWRERLADIAWILTKNELIESGLFGPVKDFTAQVIGDVIVFPKLVLVL